MIVDKDMMEKAYMNTKEVSETLAKKKEVLEKNRFIISTPDGKIPQKYQKSFKELENTISMLEDELSSKQEVLLKFTDVYVRENAMGNLVYEKGVEGTEFFFDTFTRLYDANFTSITKAITMLDLERIERVISLIRERFLALTFPAYCEYSKKLSFNR